jgi:hypothetical protein
MLSGSAFRVPPFPFRLSRFAFRVSRFAFPLSPRGYLDNLFTPVYAAAQYVFDACRPVSLVVAQPLLGARVSHAPALTEGAS